MVDAVLAGHSGADMQVQAGSPVDFTLAFNPAGSAVLERYRAFAAAVPKGPAQHPVWVEAWGATSSSRLVMMEISHRGAVVLMMPLEIIRRRGLTIARAIGGTHANGNFPASDPSFARNLSAELTHEIDRSIRRSDLDADLVLVERQAHEIGGHANPLAALASTESPNVALAVDLNNGFGAVLDRVGRKRRLKKHRAQTRKLEAAGGFGHREAKTEAEVEALLAAFLQQKGERFRKLGIENVFTDHQPFFEQLFKRSLAEAETPFRLHALEVGDKLRAVTGSSHLGDRVICEFSSIAEDELLQVSPGDFLSFLNIEAAADQGATVYDFSVGDEPYKRGWCDLVSTQFDIAVPLTLRGRAYAALLIAASRAKRQVKSNERLWSMVKRLRRSKAAASGATAEADD
ncbi:MAG TPA: GNAT family N-acetyltransferase [Tianweitania sediminis]|nr:GNAT family N-acetyltransferase [Tianweitania sediminis]